MAISPCKTLNVQTIRTSQLANLTNLGDNDLIQISEFDGSKYYSRKATVSTIVTYLSTVSNGHYTGSFQGNLDIQSGITGSITLSPTVGASSGTYLPVKINGTTYKLQLFDET